MSQSGLTQRAIATALGLNQVTIYKQLKKLKAEGIEPFALSSDIIRNMLPIAALRQAQAVLDDGDTERADQASYRMLKGGGVYQEQVVNTNKAVPDAEIMLTMTDMLMAAMEQAVEPAEYRVETDTKPDESSGESTADQAVNHTEPQKKPTPKQQADALQELRIKGQSLGSLIASENARRTIATADTNRTEGRPESDDPTTTT